MATVRLTEQAIPHLPPGEHWDEIVRGLHVRVSEKGRRTFALRYRVGGEQPRERLGVFHPTYYTLARARDDARAVLASAAAGRDPRTLANDGLAFEKQAERVLARRFASEGLRAATRRDRSRMLDSILIPAWGDHAVTAITRSDVKALRDRLAATPAQANRVVRLVSLIFNELLDDEIVDANPAHRLKPLQEAPRIRALTRDEIGKIWRALDREGEVMGGAVRAALLTAQRIGVVRRMRWDQIRGRTWRIPADVFGGKREAWVPLSPAVLDVLDGLIGRDGEWVFPALRSDSGKGHLVTTTDVPPRIARKAGIPPFRIHDFREAFRTHSTRPIEPQDEGTSAGCGVDPAVADAVLGRKEGSAALAQRDGWSDEHRLDEKREALERWARFVLEAG